ncbi:MAG: hypothetical protein PHQ64_02650 [Bacilli bacterium]|nr:hypothetical protein [Bacilli bacterium]
MKLNKKILIFIIFIIAIRLLITYYLRPYIRTSYVHDDMMVYDFVNSLINGNYLGTYNHLTLTKGIMYPLFVSILSIINIPYLFGINILYIVSITIISLSLRKIINNDKVILILFTLLLFNPISFAEKTYLLFYRNWFSSCIIFIYFGLLFRIINKSKLIDYITLGIFLGIAFLTREDAIWLIPSLLIMIIFIKEKILFKLIPVGIVIFFIIINSIINYSYYGVFTYNELVNSSFKDAYSKVLNIKGDTLTEKIDIASKNSDTFKEFYDVFEKTSFYEKEERYKGNFIWLFRAYVNKLGYYKDSKTADNFYKKIINELDDSNVEINNSKSLVLVSDPKVEYLYKIPMKTLDTYLIVSTYKDVLVRNNCLVGDSEFTDNFYNIVNYKNNDKCDYYSKTNSSIILNNIIDFYKVITPILMVLGFISYIYLLIKKKSDIIINILFISTSIYILGVVYTDISSFRALYYYYLSPLYVLLDIFYIICIYKGLRIIKKLD